MSEPENQVELKPTKGEGVECEIGLNPSYVTEGEEGIEVGCGKGTTLSNDDSWSPTAASEAFTTLLNHCGSYGRWQWKLMIITSFCGNFTSFSNLGAVFLAAPPDHWCSVPGLDSYTSYDLKNISIPWVEDSDGSWSYSRCNYYDRNYSQIIQNNQILNNLLMLTKSQQNKELKVLPLGALEDLPKVDTIKCTSWIYDNSIYDSTVVSEWDLVCDDKFLMSCAQATYMGGILFGAIVISELSDKFGRRTMGVLSAVAFFIASLSTCFSPNYATFLVLRFLVATFSSGVFLSNFVNMMEGVGMEGRVVLGTFYHGFFATGFCIMVALAYFIRSWRYLQLAFSLPIIVLLAYYWILPESPRWLMAQGRHEEAMVIMKDIAEVNGGSLPEKDQLDRLISRMTPEKKGSMSLSQKLYSSVNGMITLVRTPNMRRRNCIMFFAWFVVSMVYYGLTFSGGNIKASIYLTVGLGSIVEIPSLFAVIWVINRIGRRGTLCLVLISSGVACLLMLAVPNDMGWLNLVLVTTGKFFMSPAFNCVFLISAELVPTHVRNIAVGTSSMFARIGSGLAPFIVDLLGEIHYVVPSTMFGALAVTSGLLSFLLPETGDMGLPETIEEVEAMPR